MIYPYFKKILQGATKLTLDFGCGPGRFSGDIAEMTGGKVIGTDIMEALIKMAPEHPCVEYALMKEGRLPLPGGCVDAIWCCLVLGGIRGSVLESTIKEFNRVLKPGGFFFLVEGTAAKPSGDWIYRPVSEYKSMFSFVSLEHLGDYHDCKEPISIMAGRKN
jgi:SAM-dependent methyltransferase